MALFCKIGIHLKNLLSVRTRLGGTGTNEQHSQLKKIVYAVVLSLTSCLDILDQFHVAFKFCGVSFRSV